MQRESLSLPTTVRLACALSLLLTASEPALSAAAVPIAPAAPPKCETWQFTTSTDTGRIVACREATAVPGIQDQLDRLTKIVEQGSRNSAQIQSLLTQLNDMSKRLGGNPAALAGALSRELRKASGDSDAQLARRLAEMDLRLEAALEKLEAMSSSRKAPSSAASLSDASNALLRLELDRANQILDGISDLQKQVGVVDTKVDKIGVDVSAVRAGLQCTDANSDNLVLGIRSRNAARVLAMVSCNRDLLTDLDVRTELAAIFSDESFDGGLPFLRQLREGGIDFLRDFAPVSEGGILRWHSTPLWWAAFRKSAKSIEWIESTGDSRAIAKYPATYIADMIGEYAKSATMTSYSGPEHLAIIRFLVTHKAPYSSDNYLAFRTAILMAAFCREPMGSVPFAAFEKVEKGDYKARQYQALAPFWNEIANLVAPPDRQLRREIATAAAKRFVDSAVREIDHDLERRELALALGGARSSGGAQTFVPEAQLQDSDFVEASQFGGVGWVTVASVRRTIQQLNERKSALLAILADPLASPP